MKTIANISLISETRHEVAQWVITFADGSHDWFAANDLQSLTRKYRREIMQDYFGIDITALCPCHVGSKENPKICERCGIHIDELR